MIIFSDYIDLFQSLLMFLISRDQIVVVWMVSSCVALGRGVGGGIGTVEYRRMKVLLPEMGRVIIIFYYF